MPVPNWVTSAVGIYCIIGSVFFVVLCVVAGYLLVLLADLSRQVKSLSGKVQSLTDRVNTIATNVESVTSDVGVRAKGIVKLVDEQTGSALKVLEYLAPVLILFGAIIKIRRAAGPKRR